ncbi:helix-turn-helix transcriptional regulator [uncultured Marinobacter sp.]|uniref:helix-turn-helix domain-containing protein n=1 Tax=uncultured Marinobacter sp. TaxID=187379 RepID=UPI0030DC2866
MGRSLEQILSEEKTEVVHAAHAKSDAALLNIYLVELRTLLGKTQMEIASALGESAIADLEHAGNDIKLSSLKRYVEAMGAKLKEGVERPDGTHHCFPV